MGGDGVDINSVTRPTSFKNRLYTYKFVIKHDDTTLKSDGTNFKQIAIKAHGERAWSLEKISAPNLTTEETQFASGELLS